MPFEERLVQLGLLKRVGRIRLHGGRNAMVYDVEATRANAFTYVRKRTSSQPAIIRTCFGTVRATQFTKLVKLSDDKYFVEYRYDANLQPWAQPLYSFLHLTPHGIASATVIVNPEAAGGLFLVGLKGISMKYIEAPPNGISWYGPGAFPVKFRWPPIRV